MDRSKKKYLLKRSLHNVPVRSAGAGTPVCQAARRATIDKAEKTKPPGRNQLLIPAWRIRLWLAPGHLHVHGPAV
jgi:hypothetical protein